MRKSTWIIILILGAASCLSGQGLEDDISVYTSENGRMYLQPLADAFSANLNSGLYRSAKIPRMSFHISLGLKVMGSFISESQKTFKPVAEYNWTPAPGAELSTIFGKEGSVNIDGQEFPGGIWNTSIFPLAVPQLTIGSIFGTEATIRWIEYNIDEDVGDISLFGLGFRHSISQYIPLCPVDLAAGFFRQTFKIGDMIEATTNVYGVQASYSLSVLCFYGGIAYETGSLDIAYSHEEDGETIGIAFQLDAKNRTRLTAGLALDLFILKIHADYNFAGQRVALAGIDLGF